MWATPVKIELLFVHTAGWRLPETLYNGQFRETEVVNNKTICYKKCIFEVDGIYLCCIVWHRFVGANAQSRMTGM